MSALIKLTAFAVVLALSSSSIVRSPATSGDTFELLILHNNDMHARFEQTSQLSGTCTTEDREAGKCYGGFPRVAYVVKEARRKAATGEGPPVLYLNAGDTYTGTAWFTIYKWRVAAEFINALQPDAVSLGNHELDNGISGLTPFIENVTCPVLAANLNLTMEPDLESETNLMNSVVFNISNTKIGVIGYLTPETKVLAVRNDIIYEEEVSAIRKEVDRLKREGVKILIALGHSGFTKDLEIAEKVEGIDLVIGGHTNTFLWNGLTNETETPEGPYPTLVKQKSGKEVPAVQAYAYTKYLGKLHLLFNANGDLISFDGNPILLDKSIPQDPDVLSIVNKYRVEVLKETEVIVGQTSVILDGHSCRIKECNMGNLIADSIVYKYATDYKGEGWTDAPIAIIQGGGIRSSIAKSHLPSNVTKGDALIVLPFGGSISKVSVNGTNVLKMLEHAVAFYRLSLGNHEFDNGVNGLTPFIENINTPVLAANLILTNTPELAKETNLKKSTVINVAGHKVGIVGYLTPDTKILAVKNDVEYIDEIVALKDEVSNLKSQGCKIIIALGHSGFSKDLEIGVQVDGIDLVIGGHSNTFLWNGTSPDSEEIQGPYPTYVEQASGKLVPVVQAYAYTKYLGKLHLVFDSNGNLISADGNPILLNNSIPQDHDTLQIVENYRVKVNNATQARMGTSLVPLDGLNCQRMECNLGNLIADAMIYTYAISYSGKYWTDAPIAIIQGGGIRASIAHTTKPAVITRGDLLTVLPFKGSISKVTMNGSILLEMIEHSVSRYNLLDYPGEYLQYSGIKVVYDLKLPSKSRVVEAKVRCGACDIPQYSLIENDKAYSVLMPTFVADGGDGYSMLVGLPRDTYPYDELFCLKTYLQRYSDVMPEVEGRSILLNLKSITSLSVALSPSYSTLLLLVSFAIFK